MAPPPIQTSDISAARISLVTSPHKSVMAALEFKATCSMDDEAWESVKAKGVKRLNEDLYCCLKVERNATASDIKKAYRKMSLLYHPDKTRVMESSELFQVIKKAYELLSDEQARASYDHRTQGKKFADEYKEFAKQSSNQKHKPTTTIPKKSKATTPVPPAPTPPPPPPAPAPKARTSKQPQSSSSKPSLPPAPYTLRVVAVDATSVTLAWKTRQDIPGVTFELQTKLVDKVGWPKSATGISKTACRKKNLSPGTKYSFTVRAVLPTGVSEWSSPLNVCTMGGSGGSSSVPPPPPSSNQTERRHDPHNNYPYTFDEFFGYYGRRGEWDNARVATGTEPSKPPQRPAYTPPQPKPANKSKQSTAPPVPPLKMQWSCTVCKRSNPLALSSCTVCGTLRGYSNDRMNNISENTTSDTARAKERERLRERMQASARAAEQDESNKASARSYVPPSSYVPPPAAGGWARQDVPPPPAHSAKSTSKPKSTSTPRPTSSSTSSSATSRAPSHTPPSTSTYSSSYSYVNTPKTTAASPSANDKEKEVKAASAARKARRAAMRGSLKQPSSGGNPLHQTESTPTTTPRPPVSTSAPPSAEGSQVKKSALASARRALGKKVSAGLRQVKTAMA